jgi:hypothetical protein
MYRSHHAIDSILADTEKFLRSMCVQSQLLTFECMALLLNQSLVRSLQTLAAEIPIEPSKLVSATEYVHNVPDLLAEVLDAHQRLLVLRTVASL